MAKKGGSKRQFDKILKEKYNGDVSAMKKDIDSGAFNPGPKIRQIADKTISKQAEQNSPFWNTPEGQAIRQLGGGLGKDTLANLQAFGGLGRSYFPDEMFAPVEQDKRAEGLSEKYEGQFDESRGEVTKGLGQLDEDRARLSPELDAALKEVAKGAVNDPTLMAEGARARADADAFLAQAEKERQIDPIQQGIIDEQMRRSQGFTPEEKAAYMGQMERAIGLENQAAQRAAAGAGQRGIRGGLGSDLAYRANQDAMMARAAGGEDIITKGRAVGDAALAQAGNVAGTAVGQAGERQGNILRLGAGRQQDSGNILQQAVKSGQDLYGLNQARANNAMTGLGNLAANRTGMINAGSGAANAASNFFTPYLANRQNITTGNRQLDFLKGQARSNFALGGLGYATDKEAQERNEKLQNQIIAAYGKNAGTDVNVNFTTNSQKGSDAPLTPPTGT